MKQMTYNMSQDSKKYLINQLNGDGGKYFI